MARTCSVVLLMASVGVITRACMPPTDLNMMFNDLDAPSRAFGQTLNSAASPLIMEEESVKSKPVKDPVDLFCYDFDDKCRWRNVEGVGVDQLDWYQGAGFLDESRLKLATGTHLSPDGYYAIVATDKIEGKEAGALLVSDPIDCQLGRAELRFMYWTSPEVRLVVCTKALGKSAGDYDFCAPGIENGDPGPAYVSIPDLGGEPFQIYIRAESFVSISPNIQGGFAIIDSLEYYGDFCPNPQMVRHRGFASRTMEQQLRRYDRIGADDDSILVHSESQFQRLRDVCQVLDCAFNATDFCSGQLQGSSWLRSVMPTADLIGGIPGDASQLPFNPEGSFIFVAGPQIEARFKTRPFELEEEVFLMFAYFKSSELGDLRVYVKKSLDTNEELIFKAPKLALQSRRWFREVRQLYSGSYDYIAFEVTDLPLGFSVGLDEMILLDRHKHRYCRP